MPSEPDNTKMEELLKAYAKKREDAAGAPLEVHPATRRLLQGEVARAYPKTEASPVIPWYRMVFQFWPRIAFAMGLVVVLGSTLWMLNRDPGESHHLSLARNESMAPEAASHGKSDFDRAAGSAKSAQLEGRLDQPANAPLPAAQPAATSPTSRASSAPAPVIKPSDAYNLALADRKSPKTISEKETAFNGGISADQNRVKLDAANPAAPLSFAVPALEGMEPNFAKAKSAPRGALNETLKAGKELSQGLETLSATDATQKRGEPGPRRYLKESLAKTERSPESPATTLSAAPAYPPIAAGLGAEGRVMSGPQKMELGYGMASTWTNTAYVMAQNQVLQNGRDNFGRVSRFGEGANSEAKKPIADKAAPDQDSRLVGGFGNVGGDGRYGLLKAQAEPKAAKANSAPGGAAAAGAAGTSAGATVELRGFAGSKPYALGLQGNEAGAGFGVATSSVSPRYVQNSLATGVGGGGLGRELPVSGGQVLDHFQLLQSDNVLRIVDSDGSVYEGKMLAEGEQPLRLMERGGAGVYRGRAEAPSAGTAERLNREAAAPSLAKDGALVERAQFKVSGINRTLGQLVVVTGRLDREPIHLSEGKSFGANGQSGTAQQRLDNARGVSLQPKPAKDAVGRSTNMLIRISGTAMVGGTNQILLEAIPVGR
jgi:hypothetical protein